MVSISLISLVSAIMAIIAISISLNIFKKVYQEDYKKPWLFIGISSIFLGLSQLIQFLNGFYNIIIYTQQITELVRYILDFLSISTLAYGLVLEYLILTYFKGKFVKVKFIPVQEGTIGGEIDLDVTKGKSYFAIKKEKKFIYEQFSDATRKGYEGFLITEQNPKEIRLKYGLAKTPIAWINQINPDLDSSYLKNSLDENSDVVDPLQLNNLINFIDTFLEQSQNPFILLDLNQILRTNSKTIIFEFLKYISNKSNNYNGILVVLINEDLITQKEQTELKEFMLELE